MLRYNKNNNTTRFAHTWNIHEHEELEEDGIVEGDVSRVGEWVTIETGLLDDRQTLPHTQQLSLALWECLIRVSVVHCYSPSGLIPTQYNYNKPLFKIKK